MVSYTDVYIPSSVISISHHNGVFVIVDEPSLAHHYLKSIVYFRVSLGSGHPVCLDRSE